MQQCNRQAACHLDSWAGVVARQPGVEVRRGAAAHKFIKTSVQYATHMFAPTCR